MATVDDLISQKSLRKARDLCLGLLSQSTYATDTRVLERLCHIAFLCKKHDQVVQHGEKALLGFQASQERNSATVHVKGKKKSAVSVSVSVAPVVQLLQVLLLVGRSLTELGDKEEALETATQGLLVLRHAAAAYSSTPSSSSKSSPVLPLPPALLRPATTSLSSSPHSVTAVVVEVGTVQLMPVTSPKGTAADVLAQQKELITLELVRPSVRHLCVVARAFSHILSAVLCCVTAVQDFKADLTSCLFQLGRNEEAGAVVNTLIGHPSR